MIWKAIVRTWRPLLVIASVVLGWMQSGPSIDIGLLMSGKSEAFRNIAPTPCSSIMIGYACALKNGNETPTTTSSDGASVWK